MKVLTVFAHNDRHSFCGGVLERFSAGLTDAGHTNEVLDLYAIKFDPVFRDRDVASYTSGEITDRHPRAHGSRTDACCGHAAGRSNGSWHHERCAASHPSEIAAMIRSRMPKDVLAQQKKVAAADASRVHRARALLQLPVDPQRLDRPRLHPRLRVRPHLGRLARRHQRTDPAPAPSARAHHDLDDLRQERLRRRHPRRHRQGHRRLGLPLPRHRTTSNTSTSTPPPPPRPRPSTPISTRPTNSARTSACPASASIAHDQPRRSCHEAATDRVATARQRGETCDRCAATQHEVEHAVHTLEQTLRPLDIEPHLEIRELDEASFEQDPGVEPHLDRGQADGGMARRHRRKQPLLLRVRRLRMPHRRSPRHHLRSHTRTTHPQGGAPRSFSAHRRVHGLECV